MIICNYNLGRRPQVRKGKGKPTSTLSYCFTLAVTTLFFTVPYWNVLSLGSLPPGSSIHTLAAVRGAPFPSQLLHSQTAFISNTNDLSCFNLLWKLSLFPHSSRYLLFSSIVLLFKACHIFWEKVDGKPAGRKIHRCSFRLGRDGVVKPF